LSTGLKGKTAVWGFLAQQPTQPMNRLIVQIYEIQTPAEARAMLALGVDHIGTVLVDQQRWDDPTVRDTVRQVRAGGARSSLIPLFSSLDTVLKALAFHQPDVVHLCNSLGLPGEIDQGCRQALRWQQQIRQRFPGIRIMRSIPIGRPGRSAAVPTLEMAARLAPVSDFFLTDTWLGGDDIAGPGNQSGSVDQPVEGFVGITGKTCDWDMAARLVATSPVPVILAGGIGPDNVAEAIDRTSPAGIDSCTGTNAVDGQGRPVRFAKDTEKVKRLVETVRRVAPDEIEGKTKTIYI